MILKFRKVSVVSIILALFLTFMGGCSNAVKPSDTNSTAKNDKNQSSNTDVNANSAPDKNAAVPQGSSSQEDTQKALLMNIKKLAQQGKVINSEFPVKTTVIDDIEKKLGKPDKTDWVPAAKGTYATYSKHKLAFGFNKGAQIFEVRSFDNSLNKIPLSMVKKVYGTPAYDVKNNDEEIIGYTAGQDYKILLVFPKTAKGSNDPLLAHYSVLYPKGTANLMADDPGRQW
ncbi:YjgB family protein [Clostridiaceae bacterium UIB06]|uniref:YjgB family protein n=1 Tax=Clostridium thailandense TaxID=2794346 RepID=A0A949TJ42_9CLOT|nr:YjgB family protein [Clostridium thailandense]MBV7273240.1 YjgB family protein [Clostridium thailandense]MCH5137963.1 YjgB family protein [Clostridiaceae bacterium UIB06]